MAAQATEEPTTGYLVFLSQLGDFIGERGRPGSSSGLIVVHLHNLNRINTTAGYRTGRLTSELFAAAVRRILRASDRLVQLTDDRLGVVFDEVRNAGHLALAANRIVRVADELTLPDGSPAGLTIRAGAALYPEHGNSPELLLRHGELALESARKSQASFAVYRTENVRQLTEEWDLETELRAGLENSEFHICYQPKIDARSMRACGVEALLRWDNPSRGRVSPERFIAVAERSEIIDSLTEFALHSAARDSAEWPAVGRDLNIAVNVSPGTIEHGNILAYLEHVAAIWGIDKCRFTVEVTENGIISTGSVALEVLARLRAAGIRVSIDDFGTGNSSLAYFKDIPADEVKIDKSFVLEMLGNRASHRLVKSIIDLAHSFELKVVAEGVETAECADSLRALGCDVLQGYHFSKPVPQAELLDFLSDRGPPGQRAI